MSWDLAIGVLVGLGLAAVEIFILKIWEYYQEEQVNCPDHDAEVTAAYRLGALEEQRRIITLLEDEVLDADRNSDMLQLMFSEIKPLIEGETNE